MKMEQAEKEAAKQAEIQEYESPSVQKKPFGTGKEIAVFLLLAFSLLLLFQPVLI